MLLIWLNVEEALIACLPVWDEDSHSDTEERLRGGASKEVQRDYERHPWGYGERGAGRCREALRRCMQGGADRL